MGLGVVKGGGKDLGMQKACPQGHLEVSWRRQSPDLDNEETDPGPGKAGRRGASGWVCAGPTSPSATFL